LYAYTGGDPVNFMDPFGLGPQTTFWQTGVGSVLEGAGTGLRQGVDNFNNTFTFGLYDKMGWSNSAANSGWEHDLSRSLATIPRDVAIGAVVAGAANVVARTASSIVSSLTNTATLANGASIPVRSVATPQGAAFQTATAEAQAALRQAQSGAPVYRTGTLGTQHTAEAQYWSFQNPVSTPGYANRMGMPSTGSGEPFIMGGRVNPSGNLITREAPGVGGNLGGSVEAVTQPGGVIIDWFHMP
ncbi:MAG: hypothetical protein WCG66_13105, partial [bacterium]